MASRRSRLQIKPNIGGPKLPGVKPGSKATDSKAAKIDNPATTSKTSNSPRKGITRTPSLETQKSTESPKKGSSLVSSPVSKLNRSPRKSVDFSEKGEKATGKDKDKTQGEIQSLEVTDKTEESIANEDGRSEGTKSSLNRFTRLSPRVLKNESNSAETTSQGSNNKKNADNENINTNISVADNKSVVGKSGENQETSLKEEQQSNMAKATTIPRRSRFPKAKPNVVDASKKRQRNSIAPPSVSPVNRSSLADPPRESPLKRKASEDIKIVTEDEIVTEKTVDIIDESCRAEFENVRSPQPFIPLRSPVKHPSGSFNHLRLPVKLPGTQPTVTTPNPAPSPAKEPHGAGSRTRTMSTSEAPVIKKPRRPKIDIPTDKPPDRATMKMRDLIHWNPSSNPMKVKEKAEVKVNKIMEEKENKKTKEKPKTLETQTNTVENSADTQSQNDADDADAAMPVPQIMIGPDGNIIINEKSLVVENNNGDKNSSQDDEVIDETDHMTTYASFRKRNLTKRWTKKETTRFYKALAMIGADFFMMQKVFPKRTREEIKNKFKREEKTNSKLVEKVLKEGIHFDRSFIENGEDGDSSEEEVKKIKHRDKPKEEKLQKRKGKKPKALKRESAAITIYEKMSDEETESQSVTQEDNSIVQNDDDADWEPPSGTVKKGTITAGPQQRDSLQRKAKEHDNNTEIFYATPLDPKPIPRVIKMPNLNRLKPKISESVTSEQGIIPNVPNSDQTITESFELHNDSGFGNETTQSIDVSNSSMLCVPHLTTSPKFHAIHSASVSHNLTINNSPEKQSIQTTPNWHNFTPNDSPEKRNLVEKTTMSSPALPMMPSVQNNTMANNSGAPDDVSLMNSPNSLMQFQTMSDSSDQYVLVTVVPEGSQETVIHIYKVPGAASPGPGAASPGHGAEPQITEHPPT